MNKIHLGNGHVALVDEDDYEALSAFRWRATNPKSSFGLRYAFRTERSRNKRRTIYMHRQVTNAPKSYQVDHINGCGLDNRKINLRLCSQSQNNAASFPALSKTGFRGVYWQDGKYRARVWVGGKSHHLGYFDDAIEAARARDVFVRKAFGGFARLNFPSDEAA